MQISGTPSIICAILILFFHKIPILFIRVSLTNCSIRINFMTKSELLLGARSNSPKNSLWSNQFMGSLNRAKV